MKFYDVAIAAIRLYMNILYKVTIVGKENVPKEGRCIVCANHSTQLDPPVLSMITRRQVFFMAKKELFEQSKAFKILLKALGVFPVERETGDVMAIKKSLRLLKDGELFGMFPEGTRTEKKDLSKAKPGVGMIAVKSKSPVLPVRIESEYKFRKPLKITIGKPMSLEEYHGKKLESEDYVEISKKILERIYSL